MNIIDLLLSTIDVVGRIFVGFQIIMVFLLPLLCVITINTSKITQTVIFMILTLLITIGLGEIIYCYNNINIEQITYVISLTIISLFISIPIILTINKPLEDTIKFFYNKMGYFIFPQIKSWGLSWYRKKFYKLYLPVSPFSKENKRCVEVLVSEQGENSVGLSFVDCDRYMKTCSIQISDDTKNRPDIYEKVGYFWLKITKEGKVKHLPIPIKCLDIDDFIEIFSHINKKESNPLLKHYNLNFGRGLGEKLAELLSGEFIFEKE
jgi:hypothetical protein